jgi:hypothetical protein
MSIFRTRQGQSEIISLVALQWMRKLLHPNINGDAGHRVRSRLDDEVGPLDACRLMWFRNEWVGVGFVRRLS